MHRLSFILNEDLFQDELPLSDAATFATFSGKTTHIYLRCRSRRLVDWGHSLEVRRRGGLGPLTRVAEADPLTLRVLLPQAHLHTSYGHLLLHTEYFSMLRKAQGLDGFPVQCLNKGGGMAV